MYWVQLSTSVIQFLCFSILQTFLRVTLTRRSANSSARLLRYFGSSCSKMTIIGKIATSDNFHGVLCVRMCVDC